MSTKGLTLGDGLVICAILLLVCAVAIPGLMSSRRASNERQASTALKTLTAALSTGPSCLSMQGMSTQGMLPYSIRQRMPLQALWPAG